MAGFQDRENLLRAVRDIQTPQRSNYVETNKPFQGVELDEDSLAQAKEFIRKHEGFKPGLYDDMNPNVNMDLNSARLGEVKGTLTTGTGIAIPADAIDKGVMQVGEKAIDLSQPISADDQEYLYDQKIREANDALKKHVDASQLYPEQRTAMLSRMYNLGESGFKVGNFGKLLDQLKAQPERIDEILPLLTQNMDEVTAKGEVLPGLVKRRKEERGLMEQIPLNPEEVKRTLASREKSKELAPSQASELNKLAGINIPLPTATTSDAVVETSSSSMAADRAPANKQESSNVASQSQLAELLLGEYRKSLQNPTSNIDESKLAENKWLDAISSISNSLATYGANPTLKTMPQTQFSQQYLAEQKAKQGANQEDLNSRINILKAIQSMQGRPGANRLSTSGGYFDFDKLDENGNATFVPSPMAEANYKLSTEKEGRIGRTSEEKLKDADRPSDKQTEQFAGYDEAINYLKSAKDIKTGKNVDTGFLSNLKESGKSFFGVGDVDAERVKSYLGQALAEKIKALSGTAVSEQERKFLNSVLLPSFKDNDTQFADKLERAIQDMERARQLRVDAITKQGKNVEAFKNPSKEPASANGEMKKVIAPNGSVRMIPVDKLDAALKAGGKLAE